MSDPLPESQLSRLARQDQFLDVIDRDEARRRFHSHLRLVPLGQERVPLYEALDRVLAEDILAAVDVPGFDRANVDGFALRASDTFGGTEHHPRRLRLNEEILSPGKVPRDAVRAGTATAIATGGMLPRGADAVLMVEHSDLVHSATPGDRRGRTDVRPVEEIAVTRAVSPGEHVSYAGTDIARGETVLRAGQVLSSREIGLLAAIGAGEVRVFSRPRVAILSTGDEMIAPGSSPRPGAVYDSNGAILAAAVRELGAVPVPLGIVHDDETLLAERIAAGLEADLVLLSGGTSKGAGDLSYRVVSRLADPGIVVHGVALKPGKPICLAVTQGKPVVVLPGFPTSAIFTFHEFVAPVIRAFAGRSLPRTERVAATLPIPVNSERGRTEYLLVSLVHPPESPGPSTREASSLKPQAYLAFPMGKGSGSVTTFSSADGFITIDQHTERLDADTPVVVQLLGQKLEPADLVVIGSHCVGLDYLLGQLQHRGISVKSLHVGSSGGLAAARRAQCDLAGIHLMDPVTGVYNRPFLGEELLLIPGYRRMQGFVFRRGDNRFAGRNAADALAAALTHSDCTMVNRNGGSGTRILIDRLLSELRVQPNAVPGYAVQAKSHNAVAAAISQGRADWGIAIDSVAAMYQLDFLPIQEEHYDFVTPVSRTHRPAVEAFRRLLEETSIRERLQQFGFRL